MEYQVQKPERCIRTVMRAIGLGCLALSALGSSAWGQLSAKGSILYSDWKNGGLYQSRIENWSPKKVSGMDKVKCARYSYDGKLIATLDSDKKIHVSFSDFSGRVEIGGGPNPMHQEAWIITWVRNGKWDYEISYTTQWDYKSYEIKVDFANKTITKGASRTIGQSMSGRPDKNKGVNGAAYSINNRILARTSWRTQMHTMPDANIVAKYNDSYMWGPSKDLQQCHPTLSRDGEWVAMIQHTDNEKDDLYKGLYGGSHTGIVLQPWMKPGDPKPTVPENYILVGTDPNPAAPTTAVVSYHWSNHPRFLIAGGEINQQVYILELATYPPKRKTGRAGDFKWHKLATTGMSGAPFGMDMWIESGVENQNWADGFSWKGEGNSTGLASKLDASYSTWTVNRSGRTFHLATSAQSDTRITIHNTRGESMSRMDLQSGSATWVAPEPGIYLIRDSGGSRTMRHVVP